MTCDLCTLWQRLGRGARDPLQHATALIFVELKYFDQNRQKKAENKVKREQKEAKKLEGKKRGATESPKDSRPVKKNCVGPDGGVTVAVGSNMANDGGNPVEVVTERLAGMQERRMELDLLRVAAYRRRELKNGQKAKRSGNELDPAEDDFVNAATRHFKCYRRVIMLYFGNEESGECFRLWHDATVT